MPNRSKKFFLASLSLSFGLGLGFLFLFLAPLSSPIVEAADVQVDAEVVAVCGDDFQQGTEECDGASAVGNCLPSLVCKDDCTCAVCGDLNKEADEECEIDSDCAEGFTCNASCDCQVGGGGGCTPYPTVCTTGPCVDGQQTTTCRNGCSTSTETNDCGPQCSDGNIDPPEEECDDGNLISGDGCDENCTFTGCGNNIVTTGEDCDDGNLVSDDGCSASCQLEIGCGNGVIDPPDEDGVIEECDDDNTIDGDGCDSNCTFTGCGNSIVTFGEECDDGNLVSNDGCSDSCQLELCGNGAIDPGEECDDGNVDVSDSCDTQGLAPNSNGRCTVTFCSDGATQSVNGEECDDGNLVSNDGCSASCLLESVCPNSVVEAGEECDPPGFGCSDSCQFELVILTYQVVNITLDSAEIIWTTNLDSTSILDWDKITGGAPGTISGLAGTSYSYPIGGLEPGTRYTYTITATRSTSPFDQDSRTGTFFTVFVDECGDGRCTGDETHETCPLDCVETCIPNWSVGAWSECIDGIQTRTYDDLAECPYVVDPPPDQRCCLEGCDVACGICQRLDVSIRSCVDIFPCCGDRICEETESVLTCPSDCGLPPTFQITLTACLDGLDNDNDGLVDYPQDPGCSSPSDNSELNFFELLQRIRDFLDNPQVEQINKTAAPILIATIVINTFASFSFFNFLSYLRYFFSQPFAALFRRRRRKWGVVYNALTKQPVDLAIVRLYKKETDRIVQSRVTDRLGRYNFIVEPGLYYITVTKPKYDFPTAYLKDQKEDVKYLDLYHGEPLRATEAKAVITANIPIDAQVAEKPVFRVIAQHYFRKVQYFAAFSAVPLAAVSMLISPGPLTFSLFGFHCLLYVLFRRLGYQKPPKSWGIIYDKSNRKGITRAITRIYDKKYNKLLETRVADRKGRYAFLVNKNVYYVTAEKLGYNPFKTQDIDLVTEDREKIVDIDIGLNKVKPGEKPTSTISAPPTPTTPATLPAPTAAKVGLPVKGEPAASPTPPTLPTPPVEPKSLAPEDVKESLEAIKKPPLPAKEKPSITEDKIEEKVDELSVDRESLEELKEAKEDIDEIKEEIEEKKDKLEKLEDRVEDIEEDIEEKIDKLEPTKRKTKKSLDQKDEKPSEQKPEKPKDTPPPTDSDKSIFG